MANKLIGQNYVTPDLVAKVTGQAKYAEDFRADGMLFCKLLLSPLPHGRVKRIDTSKALAMPGVKGILSIKASRSWPLLRSTSSRPLRRSRRSTSSSSRCRSWSIRS